MDQAENPRAVIGGNFPSLPREISESEGLPSQVAEFLAAQFKDLPVEVEGMLRRARELFKETVTDDNVGEFGKLIKDLRELNKKLEGIHAKEKSPYWTGGQAVDGFFFILMEKVAKRTKSSKPGAVDYLQQRVDDFIEAKRVAEENERRQKAAEAAKAARDAEEKVRQAQRAADEARQAAERARKPENVKANEDLAEVYETGARAAATEAAALAERAEEAHIATLAKPADMVRTRLDEGVTLTAATEPYAEIEDEAKLDKEKLWPFIKLDAKAAALKAWAKTTSHNQQMAGARIGKRAKGRVI